MSYSGLQSREVRVSADNFVNFRLITLSFACNCCMSRASCSPSVVGTDAADWSVSKSIITKCLAISCAKCEIHLFISSGIAVSGLML